jgi:hypothetical protein
MPDLSREKLLTYAAGQMEMLNEDIRARQQDDPDDDTAKRMAGGSAALGQLILGINSGWFDLEDWPRVPVSKISPEVKTKVRRRAPGTSFEAALSQTPEKSQRLYAAIMLVLSKKPQGCTDDELRGYMAKFLEKYGLAPESVTMRRGELRDAGWVRDTGTKRPSDLGASMIVWEAVPEETA